MENIEKYKACSKKNKKSVDFNLKGFKHSIQ